MHVVCTCALRVCAACVFECVLRVWCVYTLCVVCCVVCVLRVCVSVVCAWVCFVAVHRKWQPGWAGLSIVVPVCIAVFVLILVAGVGGQGMGVWYRVPSFPHAFVPLTPTAPCTCAHTL